MGVWYLQNILEGDALHIASSSQVRPLAFTLRNCFKPAGEGKRQIYLAPQNQCSRQDELDSIASSHPRRRKIWFQNQGRWGSSVMADNPSSEKTTRTIEWVDDTLQLWIASHLVEIIWPIILSTQRVPYQYGWIAAALWSHQSQNLIEVAALSQSKPYPENRATLDGLYPSVNRTLSRRLR